MAFAKRGRNKLAGAQLCAAYVEVVRNTPFLVQIFLLYFGLASFGVRMPTFAAAVLAMIINIAAYAAEIIRAGLESVPRGPDRGGRMPGPVALAHRLARDAAAVDREGLPGARPASSC